MIPNSKLRALVLCLVVSSAIAVPVNIPSTETSDLAARGDARSSNVNVPNSVKSVPRDVNEQDFMGEGGGDPNSQAQAGAPVSREADDQTPSNGQPKPRSLLGFLRLWSRGAEMSGIQREKRQSPSTTTYGGGSQNGESQYGPSGGSQNGESQYGGGSQNRGSQYGGGSQNRGSQYGESQYGPSGGSQNGESQYRGSQKGGSQYGGSQSTTYGAGGSGNNNY